jgi:hypothetical protein
MLITLDRASDLPNEIPVGSYIKVEQAYRLPDPENLADWSCAITVRSDKTITGNASVKVSGCMNPVFEPSRLTGQYRQAFERAIPAIKVKGTPGAGEPGMTAADFAIESKSPLALPGGLLQMVFPSTPGGLTELGAEAGRVKRTTPFELHGAFSESCAFSIELPKGASFIALPASVNIVNDIGSISIAVSRSGDVARIEKKLRIKVSHVDPGQYAQFQNLVQEWNAPDARTIIAKIQ